MAQSVTNAAGTIFTPKILNSGGPTIPENFAIGYEPEPCQILPLDMSGIYLVNLNQETSLTVNLRVYLEGVAYKAKFAEALSQPAAPYCPIALEAYSHYVSKMPTGVPLEQNASGSFWNSLLNIGSEIAEALFPEIAPVVNVVKPIVSKAIEGNKKPKEQGILKSSGRQTPLRGNATNSKNKNKT